jgi:hypothetical protein
MNKWTILDLRLHSGVTKKEGGCYQQTTHWQPSTNPWRPSDHDPLHITNRGHTTHSNITYLTTLQFLPHSFTRRCQPRMLSYCITDYVHSESTSFLPIRRHKTPNFPALSSVPLSLSLSFSAAATRVNYQAQRESQAFSQSHLATELFTIAMSIRLLSFDLSNSPKDLLISPKLSS